MSLTEKKCVPCSGDVPPLSAEEIARLRPELPAWAVVDDHHLARSWTFDDFAQALAFTNRVGALAEEEGHHPDILVAWGRVEITLWTHAIGGLSESDFVLAAKIDALPVG